MVLQQVQINKKELKIKFLEIFSEGLEFCSKVKAKFKVKENVMPVFFLPKRPVPYLLVKIIDKELGRLEKLGIIENLTTAHRQLQLYM